MGTPLTRAGITSELESFKAAGLGGVEITPIYGVAQVESRFVPYLSPEWVRLLEHTLREASRLGLGVDMATGTGWPFGGPWVGERDAARGLAHRTWTLEFGPEAARAGSIRSTCPASCDRLLGPRGQRANRNAGGASKAADRRPRATARGECQSAGAGSRAGPLSQDASDPRAGRLLERRRRRRPHLEASRQTARSTGPRPKAPGRCMASFWAGTARSWNAPRPGARATSSITSRTIRSVTTSVDSNGPLPDTRSLAFAPSSTTRTKSMMPRDSQTELPLSSTNSRNGADTISGGTCRRSSAATKIRRAIACWRTTG